MYATNFEYDGQYLRDYGYMLCDFGGSSNIEEVSAGSEITFNTVATHRGKKFALPGTEYEDYITSTFYICKDPCEYDDMVITDEEVRMLMRWLNRRRFLPFRFADYGEDTPVNVSLGSVKVSQGTLTVVYRDWWSCYYDASFNIEKVVSDKNVVGLKLNMITNRPFGYAAEEKISWAVTNTSSVYTLTDLSDEIGHIYPSLEITCNESGKLTLYNSLENCTMEISGCSAGEVITIDGPTHIISTSYASHKIYDDFNFEYFRIGNTPTSRANQIKSSLKCTIVLRYNPLVKNSPD